MPRRLPLRRLSGRPAVASLLRRGALCLALLASSPIEARADTNPAEILDQARAAQKHDRAVQVVRMVLVGRKGAERTREFELRIRRDDDAVRSYARFRSPADVAGTQLVIVDHPDRADEQLLYLPALDRVTRVAGKARRGSFMGSDFSFEDLELTDASGADVQLLSEDAEQWVIEAVPGEDSSYDRVRVWVPKADKLPRRVEYHADGEAPWKVLTVEEVTTIDGQVVPVRSIMRDLRKGTETRLEVLDQQLGVPDEELPVELFTGAYMERQG